jgi:hypothetical protein
MNNALRMLQSLGRNSAWHQKYRTRRTPALVLSLQSCCCVGLDQGVVASVVTPMHDYEQHVHYLLDMSHVNFSCNVATCYIRCNTQPPPSTITS